MNENNILGVILAGGRSKRMGQDKLLLKIDDKTLIEHTIDKVKKTLPNVIIISNKNIDIVSKYNLPIVKDCIEGNQGPLVAVLSAMKWIKDNSKNYSWIATFPCDTPFFDENIIEQMKNYPKKSSNKLFF